MQQKELPIDGVEAYAIQARLHYRMSAPAWEALSPLAHATLLNAFSTRVRIATHVTTEAWETLPFYQRNKLARRFNMGIYKEKGD